MQVFAEELVDLESIPLECWLRLAVIVEMDASVPQIVLLFSVRIAMANFERKTLPC